MKKNRLLIAFLVLVVIQLLVLAYMIVSREIILNQGSLVRIRIRPVDPYDIFRGRYVALQIQGFSRTDIPERELDLLEQGKSFYATLGSDSRGYTAIKHIYTSRPEEEDYLVLQYSHTGEIINPFDRFYLNQEQAPEIEKIYFSQLRESDDNYISVRLKKGRGVIEDLVIGGKSVYQWLAELPLSWMPTYPPGLPITCSCG